MSGRAYVKSDPTKASQKMVLAIEDRTKMKISRIKQRLKEVELRLKALEEYIDIGEDISGE